MNPLQKVITQKADRKYNRHRDFYSRNFGLYLFAWILGLAALVYSALATYNFFRFTLHIFEDPAWNTGLGAILALMQSLIIGLISTRLAEDLFTGSWYWLSNALLTILLALFGWNTYTDFHGVPEIAASMSSRPIDNHTAQTDQVYQSQLEQARADQKLKRDRIAYLKGNCKQEDCWVKGGKAYWKGNITQFGRKEIRSLQQQIKQKESEISAIQTEYNSQRKSSVEAFSGEIKKYEHRLSRKTTTLRGLVVVALVLVVLSALYREYFEAQLASPPKSSTIIPSRSKHPHLKNGTTTHPK